MGLIKAIAGAAGGALGDQWREYFYCNALPNDVLVTKGQKRTSKRSSNKNGEENIITNGSIIAVNNGQCMIIVEQGKVVELCAEPGEVIYDSTTEPTILYGGLGEGIMETFKTIGKRFTFGGDTAMDQRIYFFNTKEILENLYGTPTPVPFRLVDRNTGIDVDLDLRCNGVYTYKIFDPILFYTNVCGNVEEDYSRSMIDKTLRTELVNALQPALAKLSAKGIRYNEIPAYTDELGENINEVLTKKWRELRGIEVVSFAMNPPSISEEDREKINRIQFAAVNRDPGMAAANLVGAQADAMRAAAANENGAMMGFMGLNMAQGAGGFNPQALYGMAQQQQQQQPMQQQPMQQQPQQAAPAAGGWTCSCGKAGNTGKFCAECGSPKPQEDGWTCSCGAVNKGKFCPECGKSKPQGAPLYQCDKCGWKPEDPKNPPKFCPECGDVFDANDAQ